MSTYTMERVEINKNVKRGEIWMVDLRGGIGSEQSGIRPCCLLQSLKGDMYAPTTKIAPITSSEIKNRLPTHVKLEAKKHGLKFDSIVLLEQSRVIDKMRLISKVAELDDEMMKKVNAALLASYDLV